MDAKYLDSILSKIASTNEDDVNRIFPEDRFKTDLKNGLSYLASKKYIGQSKVGYSNQTDWHIKITDEGRFFIANGGFTHEKEVKDSPLESNRIARQSRTLAWIALIVSSLMAIAVAYFQYRTK